MTMKYIFSGLSTFVFFNRLLPNAQPRKWTKQNGLSYDKGFENAQFIGITLDIELLYFCYIYFLKGNMYAMKLALRLFK